MDAEEIQRKLSQLSRANFRGVVGLLLKKVLLFDSINVDASGDGGADWKAFEDHGQRLRIAIQDTVQHGWEKKALDDAKKAKKELDVNRYLFFTNRTHQQTTTIQLENKILRETGLAAQVFEARTISELLHERGLGSDFLAVIGEAVASKPPELPEICLCAYGNFSADRRNHRDQIYNDTLLVACREASSPPTRDALLDAAIAVLGTTPDQRPFLEKRLSWLMSQQQIQQIKGRYELSAPAKARIAESERLYLADWAVLESAQAALMNSFSRSSATCLARARRSFWSSESNWRLRFRHSAASPGSCSWSSRRRRPLR